MPSLIASGFCRASGDRIKRLLDPLILPTVDEFPRLTCGAQLAHMDCTMHHCSICGDLVVFYLLLLVVCWSFFGTCAWYVPCGWDAGLSAVLPCSILIFDCMSSGLLIALQLIFVLFVGFSLSAMCWIIVFCLGVLGCLLELPKDKPCMLCGQLAAKELFCSRSTKGCCPQRLQKTPYGHVHTCIGVCTHIYMIPHNMIKPCRNAQLEEDQCDETRPRRQLR